MAGAGAARPPATNGACPRVPPSLQEIGLRLHQAVYVRSDGRIGHRTIGVPSLLLRSRGRRTGTNRTNALIYARDGHEYVLVASNHGRDRQPAWLLNLEAEPHVEVQVARIRFPAVSRIVRPSDPDYVRLWRLANAANHARYDAYQSKTSRPILLVVLTPS